MPTPTDPSPRDLQPSPRPPRLVALVVDGLDYALAMPMAAAAGLPHLARLLGAARLGRLDAALPCDPAVGWATLLAGREPDEHGLWDARQWDARRRRLVDHPRDLAPAVDPRWLDGGRRVAILDDRAGATLHTLAGTRRLAPPSPSTLARWNKRPAEARALRTRIDGLVASLGRLRGLVQWLDRDRLADVCLVHVRELMGLVARTWDWHDLAGRGGQATAEALEVHRAWRALDALVGDLATLARRHDAALVVLGPCGTTPFRERIHVPQLLLRRGLLVPASGHYSVTYRVRRHLLKAGRLLRRAWRHAAVAASVSRGTLDLGCPVDLGRTRALTLDGRSAALVYLNTPERFGTGPIRTEADRRATLVELTATFIEARHPETDEPLFSRVWVPHGGTEGSGEPSRPDLVAVPAPGFLVRHRLGESGTITHRDPQLRAIPGREGLIVSERLAWPDEDKSPWALSAVGRYLAAEASANEPSDAPAAGTGAPTALTRATAA